MDRNYRKKSKEKDARKIFLTIIKVFKFCLDLKNRVGS